MALKYPILSAGFNQCRSKAAYRGSNGESSSPRNGGIKTTELNPALLIHFQDSEDYKIFEFSQDYSKPRKIEATLSLIRS